MKLLKAMLGEFIGLFVDDGALALLVVLLVVVVASAVKLMGLPATVGGFVLLVGCLYVLALSLVRAMRERKSNYNR